jgi:hypothetical protein
MINIIVVTGIQILSVIYSIYLRLAFKVVDVEEREPLLNKSVDDGKVVNE